ncbi:hypothetical protein TNCV_994711 [Trichonephila clavipes]|nr:hypothetical protein TNCV_1923181 [Trichonephila clavipes]GFX37196.1 hypothetical protein TNCV_994711 [Trichonephila clavipes]
MERARDPSLDIQCPRNPPLRERRLNRMGSITLDGCTRLYVFARGTVTAVKHRDKLRPLYRGSTRIFDSENATPRSSGSKGMKFEEKTETARNNN